MQHPLPPHATSSRALLGLAGLAPTQGGRRVVQAGKPGVGAGWALRGGGKWGRQGVRLHVVRELLSSPQHTLPPRPTCGRSSGVVCAPGSETARFRPPVPPAPPSERTRAARSAYRRLCSAGSAAHCWPSSCGRRGRERREGGGSAKGRSAGSRTCSAVRHPASTHHLASTHLTFSTSLAPLRGCAARTPSRCCTPKAVNAVQPRAPPAPPARGWRVG